MGWLDRIELAHEDRNLEICFYKGDNGVGSLANEYKKYLWQLTRHFGENARKLTIVLK